MKARKNYVFILMFNLLVSGVQAQDFTIPEFKENENVVFVGNSITHGGRYHSFVWLYYMTRFSQMPITVLNAGIGGDCAWDIRDRFDDDVLTKSPSYLILTFGMNDVGYYDFYREDAAEIAQKQVAKSLDSYQVIEQKLLEAPNVKKVLLGGSPYDEVSKIENQVFPNKNAAMVKINESLAVSANKNKWGFLDFNTPMLKIIQEESRKDSLFALCGQDRIHPDNDGNMVMAYLFLKAQGLANKSVANIEIDAKKKSSERSSNCLIGNVVTEGSTLSFDYLANSLPYPMDSIARGWGSQKSQKDALSLIPFTKEFNQEVLRVKRLSKGNYQVSIDGINVGEFSSSELDSGVNLAEITSTPQYNQAYKILILNEERFEIEKRFRDYAWMEYSFLRKNGVEVSDSQEALATIRDHWGDAFVRGNFGAFEKARNKEVREVWQSQMDDIVKKIYELARPLKRKIEIVKK